MYTSLLGSYNSFVSQVGFCKLQGFDTLSRSTSMGVPMFLDGRIKLGVGLSNDLFNNSVSSCGRCIHIHSIDHFAELNTELTAWTGVSDQKTDVLAMVMDQCTDPICQGGFLDFDIYSETQPVATGNPRNLQWEFVPCPTLPGETIEVLFCLSDACRSDGAEGRTLSDVISRSSPYYFSLYLRNQRIPSTSVSINGRALEDINGWVWNDAKPFDFTEDFTLDLDDGQRFTINLMRYTPTEGYRGGVLVTN